MRSPRQMIGRAQAGMNGDSLSVALNCAILQRGLSGSATATRQIADALRRDPSVRLTEVSPRKKPDRGSAWNAGAQAYWDLRGASVANPDADILVSPCNIGRSRRGQKHLLVIYDTMVLDFPERFDRGYAAYARLLFGYSAIRADQIVVPSVFSAISVRDHWPGTVEPRVIHLPVSVTATQPKTAAPSHTVLMVGATAAHKRHVLGVDAVKLAREQTGADLRLLLVGPREASESAIEELVKKYAWMDRRINMSASDLADAYSSAFCLLQPSLVEGYGLPVVEAAAAATPVIHSGAGALSELAPGAVADGSSAAAYAGAMFALHDSESVYQTASEAALSAALDLDRASFENALHSALLAC